MVHHPHKWLLLKISHVTNGSAVRVMASWSGGWGGADEWKLSSPVMAITRLNDDVIEIQSQSGSTYRIHAHAQGLSLYAQEVLARMERHHPDVSFERLTVDEAIAEIARG